MELLYLIRVLDPYLSDDPMFCSRDVAYALTINLL